MFNRHTILISIALCTAGALMGFAYYQRYVGPVPVPAVAFYGAAAVICLLSSRGNLPWRESCLNQRASKNGCLPGTRRT